MPSALDAHADVLDRLRRPRGARARGRVEALSAGDSARQPRHHALARRSEDAGRGGSRAGCKLAPDDARQRRALHPRQRDAELRRARRRRQGGVRRAGEGRPLRAVLVGRAAVQARRGGAKSRSASSPTARRTASRAACPRPTCATPRRRRFPPLPRARSPKSGRAADWKVDLAPYTLLEQSQQMRPTGRVDHAFVYQRAEMLGEARIRLRLTVAGDELIEIAPLRPRPGIASSAASARCAARTTRSPASRRRHGAPLRPWRLRPRRAVARANALARRASGARRRLRRGRADGGDDPGGVRRRRGSTSTPRNRRRPSGSGRSARRVAVALGRRARATRSCSWRRRVSRGARFRLIRSFGASGRAKPPPRREVLGRTVGGYLFVPIELALVAVFYFATNRWLGWWQPSEVLTDPNILVVRGAGADADRHFVAGGIHGGMPLSRRAAGARRADRRALRPPPARGSPSPSCCRPSSSARRTRTIPAFPRTRAWSSSSCRRCCGRRSSCASDCCRRSCCTRCSTWRCSRSRCSWSTRPEPALQRALVIAAALVPLGVVLWRRVQAGAWAKLPEALCNGAWVPRAAAAGPRARRNARSIASRVQVAGPARVAGARARGTRRLDRVHAGRSRRAAARRSIARRPKPRRTPRSPRAASCSVPIGGASRRCGARATRRSGRSIDSSGARRVRKRIARSSATPLAPPLWDVRFALFEGDVAERAEEWRVTIEPDGKVRQVRHLAARGATRARASAGTRRSRAPKSICARASAWIRAR